MTFVHTEVDAGIACLTLTRPEKRNAISLSMMDDIIDQLRRWAELPEVRVAIIRGDGVFSAGWDRDELLNKEPAHWNRYVETAHAFYRALIRFPKPLIAAVEGYALGTAFDVALLCDVRVSADDARFGHPEVRLGGVALFTPLKQVVGGGWAREMCLSGREIDADTASRIGFVTHLVPAGAASDEARQVALHMARVPAETLAYTKSFLWSHPDPEDYLPAEVDRVMRGGLTIQSGSSVHGLAG